MNPRLEKLRQEREKLAEKLRHPPQRIFQSFPSEERGAAIAETE